MSDHDELAREQAYLDVLHAALEAERRDTAATVTAQLRADAADARELLERDAQITRTRARLSALDAAGHGLCFGRIDTLDGQRHYLGRVGLRDRVGTGEPLLLDWRAPAARAFYLATAASPEGLRRRRHLTVRDRRVLRIDDELLTDPDRPAPTATDGDLVGEAALLAALTAGRTGRMQDVVATLQREQDQAVRSSPRGVLVVQGGPGTGKTSVALHRAAYLLYRHPQIAGRGVLVVGPSPVFLAYVSDVLPGLGETRSVLSTVGELVPGITGDRDEAPDVTRIKGHSRMAGVVAAAVRDRQGSATAVTVDVEGDLLTLSAPFLRAAVEAARATRLPHNQARPRFHRRVLAELARQAAAAGQRRLDEVEHGFEADLAAADRALAADLDRLPGQVDGPADTADTAQLTRELAADPGVQALLARLWPDLTPQQLLTDLFADPERLAVAAADLPRTERDRLHRDPGHGWSEADVPLLDEAAQLLGEDTTAHRRAARRAEAEHLAYAQGVLNLTRTGPDDRDEETLDVAAVLDARTVAGRNLPGDPRSLAERARADRTWTYGHVVVDEAQELSAMAWRVLRRRCPSGSMTVVGDLAQTHNPAGATSWPQALGPDLGAGLRLLRLGINYRTPAEIMTAATRVLAGTRPAEPPPVSVRHGGQDPWRARVERSALAAAVARWAEAETRAIPDGRVAVIASDPTWADLVTAVTARVPDASSGPGADLQRPLVLLTVAQAKGLEFDSVLVVDPATILTAARGANDLYMAMTRATQALGLVHPGPAPAPIAAIRPAPHRMR